MTQVVNIDDSDPRITYSSGWILGGVPAEEDGTTHGAYPSGPQVSFMFSGTSVAVYGTIGPSANPQSTYIIDGVTAAIYLATSETSIRYRQQFFQSQPLTGGSHTLVIAVTGGNGPFWLDYLEYTPSNPSTTQISTTSASFSFTTLTSTNGALTAITPTVSQLPPTISQPPPTVSQPPPTISQTPPTNSTISQNSAVTHTPATSSTISQTPPTITHITQPPGQFSSPSPSSSSSSGKKLQIGLGVGGAIIGALLVAGVAFFVWRSRRSRQGSHGAVLTTTSPTILPGGAAAMTPFALNVQTTRQDRSGHGYVTGSGAPREKVGQHAATFSHSEDSEASMNLRHQDVTDSPPSQSYHRTETPHSLYNQEYRRPDGYAPPGYYES